MLSLDRIADPGGVDPDIQIQIRPLSQYESGSYLFANIDPDQYKTPGFATLLSKHVGFLLLLFTP